MQTKKKTKNRSLWIVVAVVGIILAGSYCSSAAADLKLLRDTVVRITDVQDRGIGTGSVIKHKDEFYVLSAAHVCGPDTNVPLKLEFDGRRVEQTFYAHKLNLQSDICVIKIPAMPAYLTISSDAPAYGDFFRTMGYAHGVKRLYSEGKYFDDVVFKLKMRPDSKGQCSNGMPPEKQQAWTPFGAFDATYCVVITMNSITTLTVYPGQSGSAVINTKNQIVGIVQTTDFSNKGGLVPYQLLREFFEAL